MQELTTCPVCNSENFAPTVKMDAGNFFYYLCECGVAFLSPCMTEAETKEYYQSGAYRAQTAKDEQSTQEGKQQHQEHAEFIAMLMKDSRVLSHLDIGCSSGELLRAIQNDHPGIVSRGVDPDPVLTSQDFTVYKSLDDVQDQFQFITMIHTLEHVVDPVAFLEKTAARLKDGGIFLVQVPNRRAWIAAYSPPQHVLAYDESSLRHVLERSGFKVLSTILHGYTVPLDLNITAICTK
jgi:SAM-dependent methyltransferase